MQRIIYRVECFDINVVLEVLMNSCIANSSSVRENIIIDELKKNPDLSGFIRAKKRNKNFKLSASFVLPFFSSIFSFKQDKYLLLAKMVLVHNLYSNTLIKDDTITENEVEREFKNYLIDVLKHKKFAELPISKYFTHNYQFTDVIGKRADIINFIGDLSLLLEARKLIPTNEAMAMETFAAETIDKLQLNNETDEESESRFPMKDFTKSELSLVCFVTLLSVISNVSYLNHEAEYFMGIFFNEYRITSDILESEANALEILGVPIIRKDIHG